MLDGQVAKQNLILGKWIVKTCFPLLFRFVILCLPYLLLLKQALSRNWNVSVLL